MLDDVMKPSTRVNPWKVLSPNVNFSDRNLQAGPMVLNNFVHISLTVLGVYLCPIIDTRFMGCNLSHFLRHGDCRLNLRRARGLGNGEQRRTEINIVGGH